MNGRKLQLLRERTLMQMSIDDSWTFYQVNLLIHTFSKHINLASTSTGNKDFSVFLLKSISCPIQLQQQVHRKLLVPFCKDKKRKSP